jgi:hypothetical protein
LGLGPLLFCYHGFIALVFVYNMHLPVMH